MTWNLQEFITPEFIATFSGMVITVTVLTQVLKSYFSFDPKWIALAISLVVSLIKQAYLGDFGVLGISMASLNALIVTGASSGTFEGCRDLRCALRNRR